MDHKIFYGSITSSNIAHALMSNFNRGNFQVQQIGNSDQIMVQIATRSFRSAGGQTSISITLQKIEDGVIVNLGKQTWLGVAASLGETVFTAIRNPIRLLSRLDDMAQDIESIKITEEIWKVVEETAKNYDAGQELSNKLRRLSCNYCGTANPVGEPNCITCGAPLGHEQPITCKNCGFIIARSEKKCQNCGSSL